MCAEEKPNQLFAEINSKYVKDMSLNHEWYLETFSGSNRILLDVGYPSRLEKEYLRHTESVGIISPSGDGYITSLSPEDIPKSHREFFAGLRPYHIED